MHMQEPARCADLQSTDYLHNRCQICLNRGSLNASMSCVQADALLVLDAEGAAAQVLLPHPHTHTFEVPARLQRKAEQEASFNIA